MQRHGGRNVELNFRIKLILFIIFCAAGVILVRLFFLQAISGAYYRAQASRQQNFSQILDPRRGNIYLRERNGGLFPLASTKEGYLLFINPRILKDVEDVYEKLSKISPLEKGDFFMRSSKTDDPYEEIAHKLDRASAEKIQALKIQGVGVSPEEWRVYPAKSMAAHVVGFLGYKGDELSGRYGVERYFEDALKGKVGYLDGAHSAGGILLELGKNIFDPPKEGYDVILTLEPNVQAFLEKKLSDVRKEWNPARGGGIILEPKTGKIIAMASFPNFDPNSYGQAESLEVFVNPQVESQFEFGSVFKTLTMAAGINERVVTQDSAYFDKGYLDLDGYKIQNFDKKGRGLTTMQDVLNESLNTGAAFVAQKLGKDNMRKYFTAYGLAEKTGITLPGEIAGNILNLNSPRDVEYATAAFGQGIAVTPLEFTRATAALANGGKIMKPYIVERIIRPGLGDIITFPEEVRQVLTPETSETISAMLSKVADNALLGGAVKFTNWTTAAKTGTAEIPLQNKKGYSEDYLHSFLAYAPAFDSRFLLFLYIERPEGVQYASQSLGKYYEQIMQFLLTYYDVPPDR